MTGFSTNKIRSEVTGQMAVEIFEIMHWAG